MFNSNMTILPKTNTKPAALVIQSHPSLLQVYEYDYLINNTNISFSCSCY